ncbi:MAG: tyrosine-type recombinase/integrase [Planctomycetes bacterium]|nr:tyrosine-type recombinase/integrase [Planctomycetota bacterium]
MLQAFELERELVLLLLGLEQLGLQLLDDRQKLFDLALQFLCAHHSCRKATATNLLEQGVELADVQNFLGHADPRTTKLYDQRQLSVTRNIVERIGI